MVMTMNDIEALTAEVIRYVLDQNTEDSCISYYELAAYIYSDKNEWVPVIKKIVA